MEWYNDRAAREMKNMYLTDRKSKLFLWIFLFFVKIKKQLYIWFSVFLRKIQVEAVWPS